jgi:hypothetical protein
MRDGTNGAGTGAGTGADGRGVGARVLRGFQDKGAHRNGEKQRWRPTSGLHYTNQNIPREDWTYTTHAAALQLAALSLGTRYREGKNNNSRGESNHLAFQVVQALHKAFKKL